MSVETVLVTGGQGFLGQHIVKLLHNDEKVKEIRVLDVKPFTNRLEYDETKPVKSYVVDITKPESMFSEMFEGVDCVFHVAAKTGFSHFPGIKELEEVNVNGTRHIIHKSIAANVGRLVFTSTSHVVVPKREPLILAAEHNTPTPPKGGFLFGNYARTKLEAENLVREANGKRLANGQGTLTTVVLRPTLLYGELDPYYVTHALQIAKDHGGCLYRIGWGGERNQVTYAGNAAWAHLLAKDRLKDNMEEVSGEVIFITDDTLVQNPYDFLDPFLKTRNMRLSSIQFPATLAVVFVLFLFVISRLLRPIIKIKNPFPHPATLYFIVCLYCFNRLKSTLRLKYTPLYSFEESLRNSLKYYEKVPLT